MESPREFKHYTGEMNRLSPIAFFSICAVVDFLFGLVKWHSVLAGIVAIPCGLSGVVRYDEYTSAVVRQRN